MNGARGHEPTGGLFGFIADLIRSASWPMVAMSVVVAAVFAAGPRLGFDPGTVLVAVAALTTAGGYAHARKANQQTNGVLDERMIRAVVRAFNTGLLDSVLRRAIRRGIGEALDEQPPAAVTPPTAAAAAGGEAYTGGRPYAPDPPIRPAAGYRW